MAVKYATRLRDQYISLWNGMQITPSCRSEAFKYASIMLGNKSRYRAIEAKTGVPWHFIALVHYRESTLNFSKNLCNGQPLKMRTTIVPKGRGPYKSFEDSAYDALVTLKGFHGKMDWSVGPYIFRIEGYNGYGYHSKGIPSPYLWGGSNKQKRGKYIADHVYSPNVWDPQLGVMTLLRALIELDPSIKFGGAPIAKPTHIPPPPDIETNDEPDTAIVIPPSPKADEGTKTVIKSSTNWAAVGTFLSSLVGFFTDWRVAAVIVGGVLAAYIIWHRSGKPDIKGWFRS